MAIDFRFLRGHGVRMTKQTFGGGRVLIRLYGTANGACKAERKKKKLPAVFPILYLLYYVFLCVYMKGSSVLFDCLDHLFVPELGRMKLSDARIVT